MIIKLIHRFWFRQDIVKLEKVSLWSWCDSTGKVELALINILFEFVEKEAAEMELGRNFKLFFTSENIRSDAGIRHLEFQRDFNIQERNIAREDEDHQKIIDLYYWFKKEYPLIADDFDSYEIINEKLMEIVKYKHVLWT